ncbi:hypothetical protein BT96DRAFT_1006780 [Gymnopus androsaceus JB14]|uniref:Uncharacterized protein n=1 Tax=Gymnopus androsaceus JB14 TaxID=1447944 RepID=A0A6A4GJ69_9AGAR|nr:hypothetical protein BT96DRAFT_1006780 [Gymnopus androsaceus JB14]
MTISMKKTKWMLFGPFSHTIPVFVVDGVPIGLVDCYNEGGRSEKCDTGYVWSRTTDRLHSPEGWHRPLHGSCGSSPHVWMQGGPGYRSQPLERTRTHSTSVPTQIAWVTQKINASVPFLQDWHHTHQGYLANAALKNMFSLLDHGHANWINDLVTILRLLLVPVVCSLTNLRNVK